MNLGRVWALVVRHLYNLRHNLDNLSDSFYWPAIDILSWGLTFRYVQEASVGIPKVIVMMLSALIFWQVVWRGQYEITRSFLEEIWNRNLVNIFTSPLTVNEWIAGVIALGMIKMFFTFLFSAFLAWVLYLVNIFAFGFLIIPFLLCLLMMGWWVGLIVTGILVYFGQNIQTLAWAGVYLIFPFSAIYYPVSSLPIWAQRISAFVPTSYIFEGMRELVLTGNFSSSKLAMSFFLNILYFILATLFFKFIFKKSKEKGLARLEL